MSFSLFTVIADAFRKHQEKTGNGFKPLPVGECNCNSRTQQALGLHSCRALSSWSAFEAHQNF
jgi:hypothetical protein